MPQGPFHLTPKRGQRPPAPQQAAQPQPAGPFFPAPNTPAYAPTETLPPTPYSPLASNAPTVASLMTNGASAAPTVADLAPSARPTHLWPAVVTLFFLAPAIAELLTGSTPPLTFFTPLSLAFEACLYGSGAILARELVRRRGLGWGSLLLLGAAYGVLEEGLVVTSWFNPVWPDARFLGAYGRLFDTNWVWALGLTMFHAVISIAIPVALVEIIFPQHARWPWLNRTTYRAFAVLLAITSVFGALLFGFVAFRSQGYTHPPLMYVGALVIAAALFSLGTRIWPTRQQKRSPRRLRALPRLWTLRFAALGTTAAFFVVLWGFPHHVRNPLVTLLCLAGIFAVGLWRVYTWALSPGWGVEQRLALASGAMGFFLLLAPVVEFVARPAGKVMTGMTLAAVIWLVGLMTLAWRAERLRARGTVI